MYTILRDFLGVDGIVDVNHIGDEVRVMIYLLERHTTRVFKIV